MTDPATLPYALGRVPEHDPRSLDYPVMVAARRPRTVLWGHNEPVLDQGSLGSCTGNALAQWLNTDFARINPRRSQPPAVLTEDDAVRLYSRATRLDAIPGQYPPTDTGSSGLAVCKAGRALGYLSGYRWAFGFTAMLMALQISPVIVGTHWYEGMFTPDADNILDTGGPLVGGHEYLILGADTGSQLITMLNSWGPDWGRDGRAYIRFADFAMLLREQGDVSVPIV